MKFTAIVASFLVIAVRGAPQLSSALPKFRASDLSSGRKHAANEPPAPVILSHAAVSRGGGLLSAYGNFAKTKPFENGVLISLFKAALADGLAQQADNKGLHDWSRTALFAAFGALYLGMFQYAYQVNVFKRLFKSTDRFTSQSWAAKAKDVNGLVSLFFQVCLDMCVLSFIYLPTFYIFKATAFSPNCVGPLSCARDGYAKYIEGLKTDLPALLKCWIPADLVCFSVALHLRLPIRNIWSFFWTVYLSFLRGGRS